MKKILVAWVLISSIPLLSGCDDRRGSYMQDVEDAFSKADTVIFKFTRPYGNEVYETDVVKIAGIKNWLLRAEPLDDIGSYPDTLITVILTSGGREVISFKISPPLQDLKYTVIKWGGDRYTTDQLPLKIPPASE